MEMAQGASICRPSSLTGARRWLGLLRRAQAKVLKDVSYRDRIVDVGDDPELRPTLAARACKTFEMSPAQLGDGPQEEGGGAASVTSAGGGPIL